VLCKYQSDATVATESNEKLIRSEQRVGRWMDDMQSVASVRDLQNKVFHATRFCDDYPSHSALNTYYYYYMYIIVNSMLIATKSLQNFTCIFCVFH
jgi:hypothetical protein